MVSLLLSTSLFPLSPQFRKIIDILSPLRGHVVNPAEYDWRFGRVSVSFSPSFPRTVLTLPDPFQPSLATSLPPRVLIALSWSQGDCDRTKSPGDEAPNSSFRIAPFTAPLGGSFLLFYILFSSSTQGILETQPCTLHRLSITVRLSLLFSFCFCMVLARPAHRFSPFFSSMGSKWTPFKFWYPMWREEAGARNVLLLVVLSSLAFPPCSPSPLLRLQKEGRRNSARDPFLYAFFPLSEIFSPL